MIFSDFAVRRPVIISILLLVLVVFGLLALANLTREMVPPVGLPAANIVTRWPGAGAPEVEEAVTRRIENELATLGGLATMGSRSEDSFSIVELEFSDGTDVNARLPEIRELINGVEPDLPDDIDGSPEIFIFEPNGLLPIFSVVVRSDADPVAFARFLDDEVTPRLARISGVAQINTVGAAEEEMAVVLDPARARARGVTATAVLDAVQYGNADVPAGSARFRGRSLPLTAEGGFSSRTDLEELVVGAADGAYVELGDVATVTRGTADRSIRVRSGGDDVVVLDILKRDAGDTTEIVAEATEVLDTVARQNPGLFTWHRVTDQREMTDNAIGTVVTSAVIGMILATIVVLFFLHDVRATLIVGVSIPLSVLFAFAAMFLSGQTINLLTMSGVTVAIGMIVDASIVVLENTWKHFDRTGDRHAAARQGAGEVGGAILASTLTSVSVFAPLAFLTGIIGIIMQDLSLTIVYALSAAAVVAVVVVPFLSSLLLRPEHAPRKHRWVQGLDRGIDAGFARLERGYRWVLRRALTDGRFVLAIAVAILVTSVLLLTTLPVSFLPPTDTGEFEIHIETPRGFSLDDTQRVVDRIDRIVADAVPEAETAAYYVGTASSLAIVGSSNEAFARIRLLPGTERDRTIHEIIPAVQRRLDAEVPAADVTVLNGGFDSLLALATDGQGYQLEIYGTDLSAVVALADQTRGYLAADPDVRKAETNTSFDAEQLAFALSREDMGALGVAAAEAGLTSRIFMNGVAAGSFTTEDDDRRIPIRVTSTFEDRAVDAGILSDLYLRSGDGTLVSYAAFADLVSRQSISTITKRDRSYSATVRGYLFTEDQSGVSLRTEAMLGELDLPPGVNWQRAGTSELIVDSLRSLSTMLAIAVFLVYVVMVIQFERYGQPLVIMVAIPFCLIGVVAGLAIFASALSIIAMLGLITLGGTVVNNAIVLVDYMNTLRRRDGAALDDAILDGAAGRLRPVLMTTVTTLFAVLPMALAVGDGSEVYAPLGQAIFGGLFTSTAITLFLVPVLYRRLERRAGRRSAPRSREGSPVSPVVILAVGLTLLTAPTTPAQSGTGALRRDAATLADSFGDLVVFEDPFSARLPEALDIAGNRDILAARAAFQARDREIAAARSRRYPRISARLDAAWIANPPEAVTITPGELGTIPLSNLNPAADDVTLPETETEFFPAGNPTRYEIGISLAQPVWAWGTISGGIEAAEAAGRAAVARLAATRHGVAMETGATAEQIAILGAIDDALAVQESAADRLVELTRENWTNGFVTETAFLDARLAREEARLARAQLAEQRGNAVDRLRLLLGVDEIPAEVLSADAPAAGRPGSAGDTLVAAARSGNWELAALEARVRALEAKARIEAGSGARRPRVGLQADISWTGAFGDIDANTWDDRGDWQATIGVGISGDLFDGGRSRAAAAAAERTREESVAAREQRAAEIESAVRTALRRVETLRARLEHARVEVSVRGREAEDQEIAVSAGAGGEDTLLRAVIDHAAAVARGLEYLAEYRRELWSIAGLLGAASTGE